MAKTFLLFFENDNVDGFQVMSALKKIKGYHHVQNIREYSAFHLCGDCGAALQAVRPGKYQCVNPACPATREICSHNWVASNRTIGGYVCLNCAEWKQSL